jgi:serine/threonine protein phosphatase PrpC
MGVTCSEEEELMDVQYAVRSETGLKRSKNEDSYRIELCDGRNWGIGNSTLLMAVADGMGGHPCGEVASMMACEALIGILDTIKGNSEKHLLDYLVQRFFDIDDRIRLHTSKKTICSHMGTTLSVIVFWGEKAVIAHVGDTRIYCLRNDTLKLLTTDHTFVQEMYEKGVFTAEMVERSPHRNILTEVVGTDEHIEDVYTQVLDIFSGDQILLSSDGLHDTLSFDEIETIMKEGDTPETTAEQLFSQAIVKGGEDDITIIVAHLS